jgi:hypothetical protein
VTGYILIPTWIGFAVWATQGAILAILIFFAVRIRPHDIRRLEGESLSTLREIRDEFKRLREELVFLIRQEVQRHEEEFHGSTRRQEDSPVDMNGG